MSDIWAGIAIGALMIVTDLICRRFDIGPSIGDVIAWWRKGK